MPLTLAVPVSGSDIHLLPAYVQAWRHFGFIGNHRVAFIPTREVASDVNWAVEAMGTICRDVKSYPLDYTPEGGWPHACNRHFASTVAMSGKFGTPWLFGEVDSSPIQENPLDKLETDYNLSGKMCMGTVVPTRWADGRIEGDHLVGFAIYPKDAFRLLTLYKFAPAQGLPFDVYHRDELRPSRHNSPKMQHMWGTVNYRKEGSRIVCSPRPENPPGTDHSGAVWDEAVIVHGCKDGSLSRLICASPIVVKTEPEPEVVETPAKPTTANFRMIQGDTNYKMNAPDMLPPVSLESPKESQAPERVYTTIQLWEKLCETMGVFSSDHLDLYETLQQRASAVPNPFPELEEPAKEPDSSAPDGAQGDPETSPAILLHETKVVEEVPTDPSFPDTTALRQFVTSKSVKVRDAITAFSIPEEKKPQFESYLVANGFSLKGPAKWIGLIETAVVA